MRKVLLSILGPLLFSLALPCSAYWVGTNILVLGFDDLNSNDFTDDFEATQVFGLGSEIPMVCVDTPDCDTLAVPENGQFIAFVSNVGQIAVGSYFDELSLSLAFDINDPNAALGDLSSFSEVPLPASSLLFLSGLSLIQISKRSVRTES